MHLESFRLRDGPPGPGGAGGFCEGVRGHAEWWWRGRVHYPVWWAGGDLPNVYPYRLIRREVVEVAYRHLGGRVGEVVASDVSVCSNFVKGCGVARPPPGFKEVYNAREESPVVMVIPRATGAGV